ncbi:hypothetical protein D3C85_1630030 [compost metagenome]
MVITTGATVVFCRYSTCDAAGLYSSVSVPVSAVGVTSNEPISDFGVTVAMSAMVRAP